MILISILSIASASWRSTFGPANATAIAVATLTSHSERVG